MEELESLINKTKKNMKKEVGKLLLSGTGILGLFPATLWAAEEINRYINIQGEYFSSSIGGITGLLGGFAILNLFDRVFMPSLYNYEQYKTHLNLLNNPL